MKRRNKRVKSEMNVVPYIDVMLVLLVIFMISTPLMQRSVEINLPESTSENTADRPDSADLTLPLILTVDKNGNRFLNIAASPTQALSDSAVSGEAEAYLKQYPEIDVYVSGDAAANYEKIIHGIDLLRASGAKQVNLTTQVPEEEE